MTASQTLFLVFVDLGYAFLVAMGAVWYLRTVRVPRPPVGVVNSRDIAVMMGFVLALPFFYLALPGPALPVLLALVFAGGLTVGYQPVVRSGRLRWTLILALLGIDLTGFLVLGANSPVYWLANSAIVGLVVVSATNLNVQGGVRLAHIAWFVLFLAGYDLLFATVFPITQRLAAAIQGYPFAPSAGLRIGELGAVIGMGDLLAYALFTAAAYKAYGTAGIRTGLAVVVVFGATLPAMLPVLLPAAPTVVPAQVFFGPAAFLGYRWLRRRGPERRMSDLRRAEITSGQTVSSG
ncbi:MAG TPA: hypothetical protein VFV67_36425 [Actinophytocola sp.]|uniref:hypothetical protein n=1 Tax=Actinophytocola sp. TaxID=1872138 RepID=UPI002DB58645|nr:hypothetical protein [Actinophytocola sp.]HEU5476143.1 hypothetical protein [Actinophytocola sp.]